MAEPYITLTEPSKPSLLGQCWGTSSWGSRLEIRLRPSLLDGTHPAMAGGSGNPAGLFLFAAAVLGLPPVAVRNRGGSADLVCAHWPHNVRDPAHYLGAWQPRPPVPLTGD